MRARGRIREPDAPRAGSSRTCPTCSASVSGTWRGPSRRSSACRTAGLFGERVGASEVWGHGGSYGGFQSSLLIVPDRDAVFVGLTSSSTGRHALRELEDVFFEQVLGARRRVPETVELPDGLLESYAGSYVCSDGRYEVAVAGGELVATFDDGVFAARPIGERTFEITEGDRIRDRFDFPLAGFGRFGSRLAARVA